MNTAVLGRHAVSACVTLMFVAGCAFAQGGSQDGVSSTGRFELSPRPPSSGSALIYAAADGKSYVLTYPEGKLLGTISDGATDACSDSAGNVFLTVDSRVDEFIHGATTPSASLSVPGSAFGCAIDSLTGNLAVNFERTSGNDIAVFQDASGNPTLYNSGISSAFSGYDTQGNLFVDGVGKSGIALAELPIGGSSFSSLAIASRIDGFPGTVQWDGTYLTLESGVGKQKGSGSPLRINRLSVSGSTVTVVSTSSFDGIRENAFASWIYKGSILIPYGNTTSAEPNIGYWKYPAGRKATTKLKQYAGKKVRTNAVTISE